MRTHYTLFYLLALFCFNGCTTTTSAQKETARQTQHAKEEKPLPEIIVIEKEVSPKENTGFDFAPYAHAKTAELLRYIDDFSLATPEWQKAELNAIMHAIDQEPENWRLKIKHAAILALPSSAAHNYIDAKKILSGLLSNDSLNASDLHLVNLLATFNNAQQAQSLKALDAAKKHQTLSKQNKALQQKLNDIKNIEKTMIERNAKSSAK